MDSQIAINIQEEDKIYHAAYWHTDPDDEFTDVAFNAFINLMKMRKEVAIEYLKETNINRKETLKLTIDYYNNNIKSILAV